MPFDHEKFDVYRLALQFLDISNQVIEKLPRGRAYLADQLQRAASSIVLNIAEGAGKYAPADKAAFYGRARASAGESSAVIDALATLKLMPQTAFATSKTMLNEIGKMLTNLIRAQQRRLQPTRDPQPEPSPSPQPDPQPKDDSQA